jgi:hypothetical protein
MNARKGKLGTSAPRPTAVQRGETERFILWARDGGRIASRDTRQNGRV